MLKCDICNGELKMQTGGIAKCENCGITYGIEALQEKFKETKSLYEQNMSRKEDFDVRGGVLQKYVGSDGCVAVPDNVIKIAARAFENCPSIVTIKLPETVIDIADYAFVNCENLTKINLPLKIRTIAKGVFSGCKCIDDVQIPDGVTRIDDFAFEKCEKLSHINLPDSIVEIKSYAFQNCINLKEFEFPAKINRIEEGLFRNCTSIHRIKIPNSIKEIEFEAFRQCSSLSNITIPDGVEIIKGSDYVDYEDSEPWKYSAFYGCINLENINLPSTLKYLGNELFLGCSKLTTINNDADPIEYILKHNTYLYKEGPFDKDSPLGRVYQKHFQWQTKGVCRYCGGGIKGFFKEVCKKCGREIDYKRN